MFDFINRAASIDDPGIIQGLDELMPYGDWRTKLEDAERASGGHLSSIERKDILVECFSLSLSRLGSFEYVAETTVLRPLKDRPLYCLFYATRHPRGIEVFRDCQHKALTEQSRIRASTKIKHSESTTGQREFFQSLHDMAPDELSDYLRREQLCAEETVLKLVPKAPESIRYEKLWPQVLARHVVRRPDVNEIASRLRREGTLFFPDWEKGKKVPHDKYRAQLQ
jgi:hypothetical protein